MCSSTCRASLSFFLWLFHCLTLQLIQSGEYIHLLVVLVPDGPLDWVVHLPLDVRSAKGSPASKEGNQLG